LGTTYLVRAGSVLQTAEEGKATFQQRCTACHTIGGGNLVGPDLQGVTERRDQAWLVSFISEPDKMLASGDPTATQLLSEFNNIAMPNLALTDADVAAILAFLQSGATLEFTAVALPPGSAQRGRDLFSGGQPLQNGGIACMSCHSVGGVGAFGGGTLGPDLTLVVQRLGEPGLVSSLQNIAFPTMIGVFKDKNLTDQEVSDLLSFFVQANSQEKEGIASGFTNRIWIGGLLGALVCFGVMATSWPRQRESLSDRLRKSA